MANLTETSTWVTPVTGIDNGDPMDSTELTTPETQLTKRTKYLRENTPSTHDATDAQLSVMQASPAAAGQWLISASGCWIQQDSTVAQTLLMDLALPPNVVLTSLKAYIDGNAGGGFHAGLPGTKPTLSLIKVDPTIGSITSVLGTATDAPADVGAYELLHTMTISGLSETISSTKRYMLIVGGETGANALNGKLGLWGVAVSWTAPASV